MNITNSKPSNLKTIHQGRNIHDFKAITDVISQRLKALNICLRYYNIAANSYLNEGIVK